MFVAVLLGASCGIAQTSAKYHLKLENDVVAVYDLDVPQQVSASTIESAHDNIWIALNSGAASFSTQHGKIDVQLQPGDARFFPSFETKLVTNTGPADLHTVVIELKAHGLVPNGCECMGNTGKTVCGCRGATHLESLWAFNLGELTLAGTSLGAGQAFRGAAIRDDMLLVAVTDVMLRDEASNLPDEKAGQSPTMNLKSGDAIWIKGGPHQLMNVSAGSARFVTVEF